MKDSSVNMGDSHIIHHLSTILKTIVFHICKWVSLCKLFLNRGSFVEQKNKKKWVLLDTRSPIPLSTGSKVGISYFEIGVGVYQGEFQIIRQLADESSRRWVVYKLPFDEIHYLSSEVPELLCQLACFVQAGQQLYIQLKDSKNLNEIKPMLPCPCMGKYQHPSHISLIYKDASESHKQQCKEIERILKCLELLECPYKGILSIESTKCKQNLIRE